MKLSTAINRLRRIKRQALAREDQVTHHTGLSHAEKRSALLACRRDIEAIDMMIGAFAIHAITPPGPYEHAHLRRVS